MHARHQFAHDPTARPAAWPASQIAKQDARWPADMAAGLLPGQPTSWPAGSAAGWIRSQLDSRPAGKETGLSTTQLTCHFRSMLIVFANSKGGVGKSTLAVHCAVWLYDQGFATALLDADQQRSSSVWLAEAEPNVTVSAASTPDDCLFHARHLLRTHDFVVADAPGGLEDLSRTLLLLADLAVFPISPSILDVRSVARATTVLRYAQNINQGRPEGRLVLNKMKTRDTISRELREGVAPLGLSVAANIIRDLQAYRDVAQQGTVVSRAGRKMSPAAADVEALLVELLGGEVARRNEAKGGNVEHG